MISILKLYLIYFFSIFLILFLNYRVKEKYKKKKKFLSFFECFKNSLFFFIESFVFIFIFIFLIIILWVHLIEKKNI